MAEPQQNDPAADATDGGTFSQGDIDALMQGGSTDGAPTPGQPASSDAAEVGSLGQAEIDAAIAAAGSGESAASESPDAAIGQSDIDALFGGGGDAAAEPAASESADAAIGQSDIDDLFGGGGDEADAAPVAAADNASGDSFGQSEIDALLSGAAADDAGAAPSPEDDARVDTLGRPFDAAAAAMQAAMEEEQAAAASAPSISTQPLELEDLRGSIDGDGEPHRVTMLNDVNLRVKIELGRTRMLVEDVLKLGEGSVVELDKVAGDPVDVYVNDRLVARGEVLVLNDSFCIRVSEVLSNDPHRVSA